MRETAFHWSCAGIILATFISFSKATVGGQYSVHVHFVAPLVTAPCQVAQFWVPKNVTCALCFCMTGSLSRCIPQPGCNPTVTTTIPPDEDESTTVDESSTNPSAGSSSSPSSSSDKPEEKPAPSSEKPEKPVDTPSKPGDESAPSPPQGSGGSSSKIQRDNGNDKQNQIRGAKPGKPKSRRRRRAGYRF